MRKARKVIIAEDQISDFELMKVTFENLSLGLELIHVKDGQELIDHLNQETLSQVALVMLDLDMPNVDGLEVLKKLYVDEELRKVPVVVFSSVVEQEKIFECYDFGANAFVRKPMTADEYAESISAIANFWTDINVLPGFATTVEHH